MQRRAPTASDAPARNLGILLREPFRIGSTELHERLASRGHPAIRAVHGNVFQYLDDTGTQTAELARRAQVTKQSMAELVAHLERHGYVERVPDPRDGRAKLVRATSKGRQLYATARAIVRELEEEWTHLLGATQMRQLRALLEDLNHRLDHR